MSRALPIVFIVLLAAGTASAQQYTMPSGSFESANTLYFHPISLIVTTAVSEVPNVVTLTYERATSSGTALILKPSIMLYSHDNTSWTAAGIGGGLRKYLGAPMSGTYLQVLAGAGWANYDSDDTEESIFNGNLLFYVGKKGKWDSISMFIDFGLGYQYSSISLDQEDYEDSYYSGTGLGIDFNFGVGFSF